MIQTLLEAFNLASWLKRISIVVVVVITLGTIYGVWHYQIWSRGYDSALADVARQDSEAIARAKQYRSAVLGCRARGMRWDQTSGVCEGR
jgi:hypothetical protein